MGRNTSQWLDIVAGLVVVWYSLPPSARTEIHARCWDVAAHQSARLAHQLHAVAEQLGRLSITARQQYYKAVQA